MQSCFSQLLQTVSSHRRVARTDGLKLAKKVALNGEKLPGTGSCEISCNLITQHGMLASPLRPLYLLHQPECGLLSDALSACLASFESMRERCVSSVSRAHAVVLPRIGRVRCSCLKPQQFISLLHITVALVGGKPCSQSFYFFTWCKC